MKVDLQRKNELFYAFSPECERLMGHKSFHNKKLQILDFFEEFWQMYSDASLMAQDAIKYIKQNKGVTK
jgi:hypothetical protein